MRYLSRRARLLLLLAGIVAPFPAAAQQPASPLLDNDRVTIREFDVSPAGPLPEAHRHASDTLVVSLADGTVTFSRRGTQHGYVRGTLKASGVTPRVVEIELKPGSSPADAAAAGYPDSFPRDGARRLFENDRVIVWEVMWPKEQPTAMHTHPYPTVSVTLAAGRQRETRLDGTINERPVAVGEVRFSAAGRVHQEEGLSDVPRRAIVAELK